MAKINILEKQVAELIAAGEVVERPASIVKELVENSVDAGAKVITVEIQAGGVRYIRVTDNGSGIERVDVENAFLRHATSKVKVSDDLEHITTMGFRGEALASIAAMCRVELLTRTQDEVAGTRYAIAGGVGELPEDAGCPVGTTITVRDVFYNTPARMKFLKKDVSEGNSVAAVVEKAALAHPEIAFKLIRDGAVKLQTPGDGQLLCAVRCILGKEFSENCIPVQYSANGLSLEGFISKPSFGRGSRSLQNFFINTRFIHSRTCIAALEEAYRNALMVGKFPSCVLNVTIAPHAVDVNVHPAKIEVRFANEKNIFDLVYYGCKTALGANQLTPELKIEAHSYNPFAAKQQPAAPIQQRLSATEQKPTTSLAQTKTDEKPSITPPQIFHTQPPAPVHNAPEPAVLPRLASPTIFEAGYPTDPVKKAQPEPPPIHKVNLDISYEEEVSEPVKAQNPYENAVLIGEIFTTYLVLQSGEELLLVDKHAAHERLLFNQLVAQGIGEERQLLMTPVSVQLSQEEHAILLEHLQQLSDAGIVLEDFGNHFVVVREVAPVLIGADLAAVVLEFADKLLHANRSLMSEQLENLYHTIACKAAIKAHDRTFIPSLEQLVQLLREEQVAHCPHGRPIAIRISKREIEKKFGRLG